MRALATTCSLAVRQSFTRVAGFSKRAPALAENFPPRKPQSGEPPRGFALARSVHAPYPSDSRVSRRAPAGENRATRRSISKCPGRSAASRVRLVPGCSPLRRFSYLMRSEPAPFPACTLGAGWEIPRGRVSRESRLDPTRAMKWHELPHGAYFHPQDHTCGPVPASEAQWRCRRAFPRQRPRPANRTPPAPRPAPGGRSRRSPARSSG